MVFMRFSKTACLLLICALDSITASVLIQEPETVSSRNNRFTLGFFSPQNSTNRYLGIWYMSKSFIVWVANRNKPLTDSHGILKISENGNLVVLNGRKQVVWSTNVSHIASNSRAQLLDSGNLVLEDGITGTFVWQSFQHPCDTFLQGMELFTNKTTGEKLRLTSWKSPSDPSDGRFSFGIEVRNVIEAFVWEGNSPYWRGGPWNGLGFLGLTRETSSNSANGFVKKEEEGSVTFSFNFRTGNTIWIYTLVSQGEVERRSWNSQTHSFQLLRTTGSSECSVYGKCGPYGICNPQSSRICSCLRGFEPKNKQEWERQNWTSGCVRRKPLQCERDKNDSQINKTDGFFKVANVKVPADAQVLASYAKDVADCQISCLQNCSCVAYAHEGNLGCMVWNADLLDINSLPSDLGLDVYIRLANSELGKSRRKMTATIIISVLIGTILITASGYFLWIKCSKRRGDMQSHGKRIMTLNQINTPELLLFDLRKLATATNNFDMANKLGEGGFGPVYKGKLENGQEIAVKRLSRSSGQGMKEFINEVELICKLQHRNLVRLLGCCFEGEEILVYEYMPNKSLDGYIFDPLRWKSFDWRKQSNIIEGIGRGLLYLHRDSRLRIIHRDLKASNILLDKEMNPKISDFGMAKLFNGNEDKAKTERIVGTYGYISPEYATHGIYSEKSDVFSFGVLLLEIVSGRKNTSFYEEAESLTLIGFAWKLWNDGNVIPLIDPLIYDPSFHKDILRYVHIGLLCVQELAKDRPTMASVMSMLQNEMTDIPPPSQPAFLLRQAMSCATEHTLDKNELCSVNVVTISNIQGR